MLSERLLALGLRQYIEGATFSQPSGADAPNVLHPAD